MYLFAALVSLFASVFCFVCSFSISYKPIRRPPGPKGKFLSGNSHQIPNKESWKTYQQWGRKYGSIVSFRIHSRRLLVLNTSQAVGDLLEKRSAIYSDRPMARMFFDLCGRGMSVFNISSLHERHNKYRRMLSTELNSKAVQARWPFFMKETNVLLQGLLNEPQNFEAHIRRHAAAGIMRIAYGYKVAKLDDVFVSMAEETSKISGWAMAPGRWLVDSYRILRYVPYWFPGATFQRQARIWRERFQYLQRIPHEWVKNQIAMGMEENSLTSRFLRREDGSYPDAEEEDAIKWAAQGLYAGGADTTVSALLSFVSLMAIHEEVQKRAQNELDRVIGNECLPEYHHLEKLEYLINVYKEVLRFAPVGPLALPHKVIRNDEYLGYHIDEGTVVIPNVWAIMRDEKEYMDPEIFNPDRFMPRNDSDRTPKLETDPRKYAFGFGARRCPGIVYTEKTLLLTMAGIISKFDIVRTDGRKKIFRVKFTTGVTSHIEPVDFSLVPRKR